MGEEPTGAAIEVAVTGVAVGGAGVARDADGRVVFVSGGLPDERVRAVLTDQRRDYARAAVVEVLEPSADRVAPPCPHVADGCGGCDWQHVRPDAQRRLKAEIVRDALRRQAHLDVDVALGPDLPPDGYRTTVRGHGLDGRFSFVRRSSHDQVAIGACLVAHPLLQELIADGSFPDGSVVLRAGARTGERLVLVAGDPAAVRVPGDVRVVQEAELRAGRRVWFHEEAAGHRFRISAHSFFQTRADGADALVETVQAAAGDADLSGPTADLYGGVGLFAKALGAGHGSTLVESSRSAVADARINLEGTGVRVVRADVGRWHPRHADVVVADPPRAGLGRPGARRVRETSAATLVLVSCDPASFARDAALLAGDGWQLDSCTLVDLFPQTSHVEVVSGFRRGRG